MSADWLKNRRKLYRRILNSLRVEQRELARHGITDSDLDQMARLAETMVKKVQEAR